MAPSATTPTAKSQALKNGSIKNFFTAGAGPPKSKGKPNASILSFFKKVEREEPGLFIDTGNKSQSTAEPIGFEDSLWIEPEDLRFNENSGSVKRRRTSPGLNAEQDAEDGEKNDFKKESASETLDVVDREEQSDASLVQDPFLEDSDSDIGEISPNDAQRGSPSITQNPFHRRRTNLGSLTAESSNIETTSLPPIPSLPKDSTSCAGQDEFEGVEDFVDDEFPAEGEEYLERLWMEEEQRRLELEFEDDEAGSESISRRSSHGDTLEPIEENPETLCPICNANLNGLTSSASESSLFANSALTLV